MFFENADFAPKKRRKKRNKIRGFETENLIIIWNDSKQMQIKKSNSNYATFI
jgi:hypothetical protein